MIRCKSGIMQRLKDAGYTSYRIRKERLIGEGQLQLVRRCGRISYETLNRLCTLLECNVGDVIEYIPDDRPGED